MPERLPRLLMALALACSLGLHWAFLQSLAWTTMLVDNLTTAPFPAALQRTFDGRHPCCLCKAVAQGRKADKKSATLLPLKKFEGVNEAGGGVVFTPAPFPAISAQNSVFDTLLYAPPTPPPRAA